LTALRSAAYFGDADFMTDDRLNQLPPVILEFWRAGGMGMSAADDAAARRRQFTRELSLVRAMQRAGVKILAGTDTPSPYVFPGSSLHDELELLVKAGLTPLQALQAATLRPAEYLGMADRLGTIAPGKLADLLLLSGDPVADIANTRRIEAVIHNGRMHLRPELQRMLGQLPAVDSSGGGTRRGSIAPDVNRTLRWAFVEAASVVILNHKRPTWKNRSLVRLYERVRAHKEPQVATVALARQLAESAFWVLKKQQPYREPQGSTVLSSSR